MELSKQEMELFLPLPDLWSKNFFYKMFVICSKGIKINFQNRKWNNPNRKWNYFSHFQASDQKTSFIKCNSLFLRNSKWIIKTGNGIIQTGNGIISHISRPLIKNFPYKMFLIFSKKFKIPRGSKHPDNNKQQGVRLIDPDPSGFQKLKIYKYRSCKEVNLIFPRNKSYPL